MLLPLATIGLPASVANNQTATSAVIPANGLKSGVVGLLSDQAVTVSVKRYVDAQALVPIGGNPISQAFTANTPNSVGWADGLPCGSIVISVQNASGQTANLSNIAANLAP